MPIRRTVQVRSFSIGRTGPWAGHCRRVATLAVELGRRLRFSPAQLKLLEQAALARHGDADRGGTAQGENVPQEVAQLLDLLEQGPAAHSSPTAGVLRVAELFAERIEFLPFHPASFDQILDEMSWLAQEGLCDRAAAAALGKLVAVRMEDLLATVNRLPVFPAVALRALLIRADDEDALEQMESLIHSDQVLAGRLIEAANSTLLAPVRRIASIPQALAYVGLEGARRVVMAQVFRPLFASAALKVLWRHSLETAVKAERLAHLSQQVPAEEAFLAGLVHDVGRLALERLEGPEAAAYRRWLEQGCDPVFAELLLCGFDHGSAGAEILRAWSFPGHLVEAVQHHHRPECGETPLACLLHVVEGWAGAEEDLPSLRRFQRACKRLGLTAESMQPDCEAESWLLACLSEAA